MYVRPVRKLPRRKGSVLVIVLISLLVATMLGASLIRTVLIRHRQMHVLACQQQALWLAEAGVQRAFRELAKTPDYDGETWEVPPDALGEGNEGEVTIDVLKTEDVPEGRLVRVRVQFDTGATTPTGFQREVTLRLPRHVSSEAKSP